MKILFSVFYSEENDEFVITNGFNNMLKKTQSMKGVGEFINTALEELENKEKLTEENE